MPTRWSAIAAATARDPHARRPFRVAGPDAGPPGIVQVGSVHRDHLAALRRWPRWLRTDDEGATLVAEPASRDGALAEINQALREQGLIVAWRGETYPVTDPASGRLVATFERAASRFWGTLTFGAHCNGYLADAGGRPTHVWIARRSLTKPTDPGLLDNLIGGGVPHGQTPEQTVVREGWEEAGLSPTQMTGLARGRVITLVRDIPEGLQHERLHVFDLALPRGLTPANQDGEVSELACRPVQEALALAAGDTMTVDAALVMLDFALRHRLLPPAEHEALQARASSLFSFNPLEVPGQAG